MSSYFNPFGGNTVTTAQTGYLAFALNANSTFYWPNQFIDIPVGSTTTATIASIMAITPGGAGLTITMPNATLVSTGQTIIFVNRNGTPFNLLFNGGGVLATIGANATTQLYLADNTTVNGTWGTFAYAGGVAAVTSIGMAVGSNNLTVGSSTTNPIVANGTFTIGLANDLLGLSTITGTGYASRTADNTWATRTFAGTDNQIAVTNPGGVAGNTTIALESNISGIASITVLNGISLEANTIVNTGVGNIEITPQPGYSVEVTSGGFDIDGTGLLGGGTYPLRLFNELTSHYTSLQAPASLTKNILYVMPVDEPVSTQVLNVSSVTESPLNTFTCNLAWATIPTFPGVSTLHAIARYSNTIGSLDNSGVLISDTNAITGATSLTLNADNTISTTLGPLVLDPNGSSPVVVTGLSYPLFSNTGNIESCALTADGANNIIFSANVNDNLLINGAMDIWQRNSNITSASTFFTNASSSYTADGWWLESGIGGGGPVNNVVNIAKTASAFKTAACSFNNVMRFTIQNTGNKFCIFQFVDNATTSKVVSQVVSFSFACAASTATNIRAAVLSWSGAADTVTKPVVTTFNAAGTNPTLAASWAYIGTAPINVPISPALARLKFANLTVPANCTNLAVMIWYDDTTAANTTTLDIGGVKLEQGPSCTAFYPRPFETEIILCKQRFAKDLPLTTNTGTAATISSEMFFPIIGAFPIPTSGTNAFTSIYGQLLFDIEMRTTPTVVFYSYTAATANMASNYDNTPYSDLVANTAIAVNIDSKGCQIQNQSGGTIAVGTANFNEIVAHHYRSADL